MNQSFVRLGTRAGSDTKERILDAAEQLFAEHGFAGTSLRSITALAEVNLAAINYHFQSKDALIRAVFSRRIQPVNRQRLQMLDECEAAAGSGPLPLQGVLKAFVVPVIRARQSLGGAPPAFPRLLARMYVEPGETVREILLEQMGELRRRFIPAFHRSLPGLPPAELLWRMNFCVGVLSHSLAGSSHLEVLSGGACDPSDVEAMIERIVSYTAAGLRAPVSSLATQG